jgi:hypothetical protein
MDITPQKLADRALQEIESYLNKTPKEEKTISKTEVVLSTTSQVKQELEAKPLIVKQEAQGFVAEKLKPAGGAVLVAVGTTVFISALPVIVPLSILGAGVGYIAGQVAKKAGAESNSARVGALAGAMIGSLFSAGVIIVGLHLLRETKKESIALNESVHDKEEVQHGKIESKTVRFNPEIKEIPLKKPESEIQTSKKTNELEDFLSTPITIQVQTKEERDLEYQPVDILDTDAFMKEQFKKHEELPLKDEKSQKLETLASVPYREHYFQDATKKRELTVKEEDAILSKMSCVEKDKPTTMAGICREILETLAGDIQEDEAKKEALEQSMFYHGSLTNNEVENLFSSKYPEGALVIVHFDPELKSHILSCKYEDGSFEHIAVGDEHIEDIKDTYYELGWSFVPKTGKEDMLDIENLGQKNKHDLKGNMYYHGVLSDSQVEEKLFLLGDDKVIVHYSPNEMDVVFSFKLNDEMIHLPIERNSFESLEKNLIESGFQFAFSDVHAKKIPDLIDNVLHTNMSSKKVERRLKTIEKGVIFWKDKKTEKIMFSFKDGNLFKHIEGSEFEAHRAKLEDSGFKFIARKP